MWSRNVKVRIEIGVLAKDSCKKAVADISRLRMLFVFVSVE